MEIRENSDVFIITPINQNLNDYKVDKIFKKINSETRRVALDLSYVQSCSDCFFSNLLNLKNKNLSIFNIPSDIFVLFNHMKIDKKIKLFVSELDFEENSRQLINRRFSVV